MNDLSALFVKGEANEAAAIASRVATYVGRIDSPEFPTDLLSMARRGDITIMPGQRGDDEMGIDIDTDIAISTAVTLNVPAHVAEPVEGLDLAAWLRGRGPGELLAHISATARRGALWLYSRTAARYPGTTTDSPRYDSLRRSVIGLAQRFRDSPLDRQVIYAQFTRDSGGYLTDTIISEEAEEELRQRRQAEAAEKAAEKAGEVRDLGAKGHTEEAAEAAEKLTALLAEATRGHAADIRPNTIASTRQAYRDRPGAISTGYHLTPRASGAARQELTLPSAAITVVAAPTSHGKTTMLQNLALAAALDSAAAGTVLYLTYEESVEDIITELLTQLITRRRGHCPTAAIRAYYASGGDTAAWRCNDPGQKALWEKDIADGEKELDAMLAQRRLMVQKRRPDIDDLTALVTAMARETRLKAVVIDYMQLLHKRGHWGGSRKAEIQQICDDLRQAATTTRLPIVVGAQVNREVLSPLDMENQHIADASDIEHSADTILLLWNSSYKPRNSSAHYKINTKAPKNSAEYFREESAEAQSLRARGLALGQPGRLYATLSKRRGGERGVDAVWLFDAAGRLISDEPGRPADDGMIY